MTQAYLVREQTNVEPPPSSPAIVNSTAARELELGRRARAFLDRRRRQVAESRHFVEWFQPLTHQQHEFQSHLLSLADDLADRLERDDLSLSAEVLWLVLRFAPALLQPGAPEEDLPDEELLDEERQALQLLQEVGSLVGDYRAPGPDAEWWRALLELVLQGAAHLLAPEGFGTREESRNLLAGSLEYVEQVLVQETWE